MPADPPNSSPRQTAVLSTRKVFDNLLRKEAELCAGPPPRINNTGGHHYRLILGLGQQNNFYMIGKWFQIVRSFKILIMYLMSLTFHIYCSALIATITVKTVVIPDISIVHLTLQLRKQGLKSFGFVIRKRERCGARFTHHPIL